ncbi:hypothetical protein COO60DRAFT_1463630 [Scenedesmus sp. NREL 46B-D3]|nr:hypothetical protein COO60DRAFT_1463630 [Scenedesmus sp. NREL 46B-D3]
MAAGGAPWHLQVSDAAQFYSAADQLPAGYKQARGLGCDLQAPLNGTVLHHGNPMDSTINALADAGPAGRPGDQTGRGLGLKPNPDTLMAGQPEGVGATALAAAQAAALAMQQAVGQRQVVALQVLGRVASLRKGQAALTASPRAAAAAAGAASVRSRMLITEVSLYTSRAANSQMALNQSNLLMGKMAIPDDVKYMPVAPDSFLFKAGTAWQFPAFAICLGSSYLQRMLARLPQLAEAPAEVPLRLSGPEAVATLATLRSVQFTCLFIALKVADQVHALGLLRFMLTNLSHNGAVVTMQQAANVEARCLEALDWRLGPFFAEDELAGDDEALWAECMGHWDYGTHSDHYPRRSEEAGRRLEVCEAVGGLQERITKALGWCIVGKAVHGSRGRDVAAVVSCLRARALPCSIVWLFAAAHGRAGCKPVYRRKGA